VADTRGSARTIGIVSAVALVTVVGLAVMAFGARDFAARTLEVRA
jgi:hypothetical protein